jgi:hypothetical protein
VTRQERDELHRATSAVRDFGRARRDNVVKLEQNGTFCNSLLSAMVLILFEVPNSIDLRVAIWAQEDEIGDLKMLLDPHMQVFIGSESSDEKVRLKQT